MVKLRLGGLCPVDGWDGVHCVSKLGGIDPLCPKMRRYGPTVQIREELRLHSFCKVDGEGGANCVST